MAPGPDLLALTSPIYASHAMQRDLVCRVELTAQSKDTGPLVSPKHAVPVERDCSKN